MSKRRNRKGRAINGIIVLDKPKGLSSNSALQEVKRIFNAEKAGHTGSLDPLATGVLPLCLGEATKVSRFLLDSDKRYRARVRLGQKTDTGDAEGTVTESMPVPSLTREELDHVVQRFSGEIEQLPPMYSALKHKGQPLYKLAREGKEVEREPRFIEVYSIALTDFARDEFEIDLHCSKGTYVRTIADDIGAELGCGAHVTALRRLQAGEFREADCITIEQLGELASMESLDSLLISIDRAVSYLPEVVLPEITASCVKQGQPVLVRHLPEDGLVRLYEDGQFIGIGCILEDGRVAPRRLLNL
ncbi:MAG: tRNA pseudouridine(55) synthase TruB [Pseudohongiellaceae bacterium]